MEHSLSIPNDTIDALRCSTCNNSLSHFPISLTEDNQNICGRCAIPEGKISWHNKIFEEVAQNVKFSCRYKEQGCCEELLPMHIPFHETNCYFKVVGCPGKEFIDCSWVGIRNSMLSHCRESHSDMFLKDQTFELNLNSLIFFKRFMEYEGTFFVIWINYNPPFKRLYCMIYHVEDEAIDWKNYSYEVVLSRDKKKVSVECVTTPFTQREMCKIDFDPLTMNDNDRSPVVGKIVFEKNIDDDVVPKKRFKQDLLSLLKCSQCEIHILPPINRVEGNRIKCNNCNFMNVFNLDRFAETLDYPCQYEKNGCDVVLKSERMRNHLLTCQFKDENCRFCQWKGLRRQFINHLFETHTDIIIENGDRVCIENKCSSSQYVIHYSNCLFLLMFCIKELPNSNNRRYYWLVTVLNRTKEFLYEIDFINNRIHNRLLILRQCVPYSSIFSSDKLLSKAKVADKQLFVEWQRLENITFKIRIFKK